MKAQLVNPKGEVTIPEPPLAHILFSTTKFAWLWAIVRIFLGYEWLTAGWHKITGGGWIDGGTALQGFWTKAAAIPAQGKPQITYDWYCAFIQFMLDNGWYSWFASRTVRDAPSVGSRRFKPMRLKSLECTDEAVSLCVCRLEEHWLDIDDRRSINRFYRSHF